MRFLTLLSVVLCCTPLFCSADQLPTAARLINSGPQANPCNPALVLYYVDSLETCPGTQDGSATVYPTNGAPPYTYAWDAAAANQTTQTATGLAAGLYYVTVLDATGCDANGFLTVSGFPPITATASASGTTCDNNQPVSASVTASGGAAPLSYLWSANTGSQTSATAVGLQAGTYDVVVTDANGCTATAGTTVTTSTPPSVTATVTDEYCTGSTDGSIALSVTAGLAPYTYNWSNGSTAPQLTGLGVGSYCVAVTDANGCTSNDGLGTGAWFIGTPGNDRGRDMVLDEAAGEYVVAGSIDQEGMFMRVDFNGNPTLVRHYSGTGKFDEIIAATNGDYLMAGFSNNDIRLTRVDANGNVIWNRRITSSTERSPQLVKSTGDTYLLMSWISGQGDDVLMGRIDGSGNMLWLKKYHDADDQPRSIISDGNGGAIMMGTTGQFGFKGTMLHVDINGNTIAKKQFQDATDIWIAEGMRHSNGNYVFMGGWGPHPAMNLMVMYMDASLNLLWSTRIDNAFGFPTWPDVAELPNGNFLVTAYDVLGGTGENGIVVELDLTGTLVNSAQLPESRQLYTTLVHNDQISTLSLAQSSPNGLGGNDTYINRFGTDFDGCGLILFPLTQQMQSPTISNWTTTESNFTMSNTLLATTATTPVHTKLQECSGPAAQLCLAVGSGSAFTPTLAVTHTTCPQVSDGSIDITLVGGTAPFTYTWNTGATTPSIGNLATGSYTVTTQDASGCSSVESATVSYEYAIGNDFEACAVDLGAPVSYCSANAQYTTLGTSNTTPGEQGSCWSGGPNHTVWFAFEASAPDAHVRVRTGGQYGTARYLRATVLDAGGTEVACDQFTGSTDDLDMNASGLTVGASYRIVVDNVAGNAGSFTLCIDNMPSNDMLAGATLLTSANNWCSAPGAFSTTGGTPDQNAGSCWYYGPFNNRWYAFVATGPTMTVRLQTGGPQGTIRYPMMAVWDAANTELGCAVFTSVHSDLIVSLSALTAGDTYYISVDNAAGNAGTFALCLNDNADYNVVAGAHILTELDGWCSGPGVFTTVGATGDMSAGTCWPYGPFHNRWFTFTATTSSIEVVLRTLNGNGTLRYPMMAIYDDALTELDCDRFANGSTSQLKVGASTLTPGNTYYVQVDNPSNTIYSGSFELCITDGSVPINKEVDEQGSLTRLANPEVRLFPNPAHGQTNIQLRGLSSDAPAQVKLFDIAGKLLQQHTMQTSSEEATLSLQLGQLSQGTYLVLVQQEQFREVKRLVVH